MGFLGAIAICAPGENDKIGTRMEQRTRPPPQTKLSSIDRRWKRNISYWWNIWRVSFDGVMFIKSNPQKS